MTNISVKNLAHAIYESSADKSGAELDAVINNAVKIISEKHLLSKSEEIIKELEKAIDKKEKLTRAIVTSKDKMDKKMTDGVEEFIRKRYKTPNVILEMKTDPKLLGGIKIQVGDEIIDTTLQHKIRKLENYLITR